MMLSALILVALTHARLAAPPPKAMQTDPPIDDAISRFIAVGAPINDSANEPTDALSRSVIVGIPVDDSANAPTDALSRYLTLGIPVDDSANAPNDAISRVVVAGNPDPADVPLGLEALSRTVAIDGLATASIQIVFSDLGPDAIPASILIPWWDANTPGNVNNETFTLTGSTFTKSLMFHGYVFSLQYRTFLKKNTLIDMRAGPQPNFRIVLVNGDVDGDNEITLADYAQLAIAFGSAEGDPNWNEFADLDGDLEVTLADYSILARNFGQAGDD